MGHRLKYSGKLNLILLLVILINGYVLAETEKDFEFEDIDLTLKKRSVDTLKDDEDLLADEAGSTPDEGSGDESTTADIPEFFRIEINFTDLQYSLELEDPNSATYKSLAQQISEAISQLFTDVEGTQTVTVILFSPGSVVATVDLGTQGFYDRTKLYNTLNTAVNSGYIEPYRVSPVGFTFRPLQDGRVCPNYFGRDSSSLPRSGDNRANLLINNEFFCRGYVKAWEYYRIVPRYSAFASVWRHIDEEQFYLVGKTELPPDTVGNHTVTVDPPIMVERGDFIAILYPRSAAEGVVAHAITGDVSERELYQNYLASFYEDDVESGTIFSLERIPYEDTSATFAIRAVMDYTGVDAGVTVPPPITCGIDQFTCKNGQCIDSRFYCDAQVDCYDQSDEADCPPVTCSDQEFRCKTGQQCIPQNFVCNGQSECFDGSDEDGCPPAACSSDQFQCINGMCIDLEKRCDSRADCDDSSDELACPSCGADQFQCKSGQCIAKDYLCDAYPDCQDNSDEEDCDIGPQSCPEGQYQCTDGECVKQDAGCDGIVDCKDKSDESAALCGPRVTLAVGSSRLEVNQGDTVVIGCNATGNMEVQLSWSKSLGSFPALASSQDGRLTIPRITPQEAGVYVCSANVNGITPVTVEVIVTAARVTLTVSQSQLVLNEGQTADFVCEASGNVPVQISWTRGSQELGDNAVTRGGRLVIRNVTVQDADTYFCGVTDVAGVTPATAQLLVIPSCQPDEFRCSDGECIQQTYRCDTFDDCRDGSDEVNCGSGPTCPEGQYACDDRQCVRGSRCDGTKDCRDGSDEFPAYCGCRPLQFMCKDGRSCIDSMLECNRINDCPDSSDEHSNCTYNCEDNEFRCSDGTCIQLVQECDGITNCQDGSDELNCPDPGCPPGDFECASGDQCIDARFKCDGVSDCSDGSDERNCPCRDNQFTCADGFCIDGQLQCDGIPHCEDRSDEANCGCRSDQFQCRNGDCIPGNRKCDRRQDCEDASDEDDCPCRSDEFRCGDGQCIPANRQCDRRSDCEDQSDEANCGCSDDEFTCRSGARRCIPSNRRCDRRRDCEDSSDEENCECRADEFTCTNGDCIPRDRKCDGQFNCRDRSDEADCGCRADEFTCVRGSINCIPLTRKCDRRADCEDSSDEADCGCRDNEFTCTSGRRKCIPSNRQCDRRPDCEDGSDEINCGCRDDEFTCGNGDCIPLSRKCDRRADCADRSDEEGCGCRPGQFTCSNGDCVPGSFKCNGRPECEDGSDEFNCPRPIVVTVTPPFMMLREGREAEFECTATGSPPPRVQWSRSGNVRMPVQSAEENGRLTIPNLQLEDSGEYVCSAVGVPGDYQATARLEVRRIGPGTTAAPVGPCGAGQSVCQNNQCIPSDYRCDGDKDCDDGSDELFCSTDNPCEPNEFRCSNGICVMKIWRCDGDNDCGNGFDEQNCPTGRPGDQCNPDEYQCRSGDQCVPASYQCDGEIDCQDRSDEIGCSIPTIILAPVPRIDVEIGGTFTIICEAMGTPTPLIVWRLNWGNIPTGERVITHSEDGRGNLTITRAVVEDSGAYTCEAINTKGTIFASPDAIIIVRRTPGNVCAPPNFNIEASTSSECLRCFCFGQTTDCYSSDLHLSEISLVGQMSLVKEDRREGDVSVDVIIQENPRGTFTIRDFIEVLPSGVYYWNLPTEFLGDRLTSYGGTLKYTISYELIGQPNPTNQADVVVMGNGITLYHRTSTIFRSGTDITISVPFLPSVWEKTDGGSGPRGDIPATSPATREDLMMVLEDIDSIYIKANYDTNQLSSRIHTVELTTGVVEETGVGRAVFVEDCQCPPGYSGLSCQDCATGYRRERQGRYLGICRPCNCHGHSSDCDPVTGQCRFCQHNTDGPQCERCLTGYYGDATRGDADACKPCPCPLTEAPNQFSPTCELERDGLPRCTACPQGYEGRYCERCAAGYIGDPRSPGNYCTRDIDDRRCDSRGSLQRQKDPRTGRCACKANVEGAFCDQCRPNTFHLSVDNPNGCIACFCMGVSDTCTNTAWNRAQVGASFTRDNQGFSLVDIRRNPDRVVSDGFSINKNVRELIYRGFSRLPSDVYYWSLPQRFLGDKITSYGGTLRFVIKYRPGQDSGITSGPLVALFGNSYTLVHNPERFPEPITPRSFSIRMYEGSWSRLDGTPATREFLMMALADLDAILIRATFTRDTEEASIRDVIMDIAEDRITNQDRAYTVEQCVCPEGYMGLSCQDCAVGFTRTQGGVYLGLCERCQCNQHSGECDPETGQCRNCQHNTEGDRCERCAAGYYGDATRGSRFDCQPCPCPLTETPNQFSPTCILDTDGKVTCTACPAGHTGRQCETCIQGYTGNPLNRGDYCKIGPVDPECVCDRSGTVPNTQCDLGTKQCRCKSHVQGRSCSSCKEGYFYLSEDNPQGCLSCWCSGITTQCSSSNYYRDELTPQFGADGTHNFALTTARLSNQITDGFSIDTTKNEISFTQFQGIQREQSSLFFSLPPIFRGNRITSYGGYLQFTIETTVPADGGRAFRDVDLEFLTTGQRQRMYYLFNPPLRMNTANSYKILLKESSFRMRDGTNVTRNTFLSILSNIEAILIRATYHTITGRTSLRDLRMDTAVANPTGLPRASMVESCQCPVGYTGLSCEQCAAGYLRTQQAGRTQCVQCDCNGHSTSCDPVSGQCLNCLHNTVGDRCERCAEGFYGDATGRTASDCRACPCPLTIPSNQFSRSCYLARDGIVTCDRCPTGYTGRDCGECDERRGYFGNPREAGGSCSLEDQRPKITVTPKRLDENVGATVVFQCNVQGQAPYNVFWSRFDGQQLSSRAQTGPRYSLTIRDVVESDSGRYVCTASNIYGNRREYVQLFVTGTEQPIRVRIDGPSEVNVNEGTSVRFVCLASGSNQMTYILSWTKQGSGLPDSAIDQNGVLTIPNVRREDAGNYVCTGSDMISMDKAIATLVVSASQVGPQASIEPRFLRIREGAPVEFTCTATGIPVPTIDWSKASGPMNSEAIIANGVLRIPSARKSDESEYYCIAKNVAGTSRIRTILYVDESSPPDMTVIVRQTSIIAVVGTSVKLYCSVQDSSIRPTLVWSRSGGLPSGSSQEGGVLTLTNIQPSSSGTYICTATVPGARGTATTEVTVEGQRERPSVSVEPSRITVAMGTTGTIRCVVTGKPQPTITWTKSRDELTSRHQVNGGVLRIVNAQMEDRGIYVCRAENAGGVDQGWTIVEIERRMKPKIDIVPSMTQTIQIGGSALFQCRVMDGDPPPQIVWKRVGGEPLTSTAETMENGVIMFKAVTGEESGGYICTATNDMGSISATATLIIIGPPRITFQPVETILYAVVGERVSVECIAEGEPAPSVYWEYPERQRGDIPITSSQEGTPNSATLTISSAQITDTGNYVCVASSNGGDSRKNLQIIVRERGNENNRGVSIDGPSRQTVEEGQAVELKCSTRGLVNPIVRWRKRGGSLPPNHSQRGDTLYIPRFRAEYSGEYVCTATSQQDVYEATVLIIVTVRPSLTISPARIEAQAGQRIVLRCTPQGSGRYRIEWSKVNGQLNPLASLTQEGVLIINQATGADSGRYRCLATSDTGSFSDGYAEVIVQVPPSITSELKESTAVVGQRAVSLSCNARGFPLPEIRWNKQDDELPLQHTIRDGVLTIYNPTLADSGQYVCTATSPIGIDRAYPYLRVTPRDIDPDTTIRVDQQVVNVGERVEMECVVTGKPTPTVKWSRLGMSLPLSASVNDVFLVIPEVTLLDSGTYVCTAENLLGRVEQRVTLYVKDRPRITGIGDSMTAALGTPVSLACEASGYPTPEITWTRKDGAMPRDYDIENGELKIKQVMPEDAGTYTCQASNDLGSNQHSMELRVGDLVPHFKQDPISYIRYPTMNDVYLDLDVLLSIRPETTDGLVLYNGQYDTANGDFVCFGLTEGYPEFRFDVGSGPAIIRGDNKLPLDQWHTVKLKRDRKDGTMIINDEPEYRGQSPGRFQGLDLKTGMYLGGVPDYRTLPPEVGYTQGFVGSVSRVALKGVDLNLGAEALEIVGIELFHACQSSPCMNGGQCQISNSAEGYACLCPQGYTGMRCEITGQKCHTGACGSSGRCVNLMDRAGFKCICPMGQSGTQCATAISIMSPEFNKTSFVSYPPVKGARYQMKMDLQFKPSTLEDGLILYSGQNDDGTGDYISIAIRNGYLEYKYNTGSGPATMVSRRLLRVGEWTRVSVSKNGQEGTLVVNGDAPVQVRPWSYYRDQYRNYYNYYLSRRYRYRRATSPGTTVGLDLRTKLYLGGVEPGFSIPRTVQVTQGFVGCITQLTVNMRSIDLIEDAIASLDVQDCQDRNICNRQPCKNGGACQSLSLDDYRCSCQQGFTGKNCEIRVNICNTQAPCTNGGACSITQEGYRCDCPLNFSGKNCENAVVYTGPIEVQGNGFVEFDRQKFPHSQTQEEEIVTLKIRTTNPDGLLFWHGQATPGQPLQNEDYLSIGLQDGYVMYSYELGSGSVTMRSLRPVNDGNDHTITVTRLGQDGTLAVDGGPKVTGRSKGSLQMLNTRGNVYVGGVPHVDTMTGGRYTSNFQGCILEIYLQDKGPFMIPEDSVGGFNVVPCNS